MGDTCPPCPAESAPLLVAMGGASWATFARRRRPRADKSGNPVSSVRRRVNGRRSHSQMSPFLGHLSAVALAERRRVGGRGRRVLSMDCCCVPQKTYSENWLSIYTVFPVAPKTVSIHDNFNRADLIWKMYTTKSLRTQVISSAAAEKVAAAFFPAAS